MSDRSSSITMRAAWAWLVGWALLRLVFVGTFALVPDETNYWQWSRHLAWGYHDQAPMIAWTIRLATQLLGHTETAVRLPSVVAMTVASAYLILIARRWMGPRTALGVSLLSQAVPEFNFGGMLATADGLQAAAWAAASYHVARGYEDGRWSQWLLGGVCFGLGLLSKYTMVLFLPGALLFGLCSPRHRPRLATWRPWTGVLIGVAMFAPVLAWNAAHNWNSLRHVAFIGGADQRFSLHWNFLGDFLLSQFALLSPLILVLILMAWYHCWQTRSRPGPWIQRYLLYTSVPMVFGFTLLSMHARVYGNWPGAGYLTAVLLAAALFSPGRHPPPRSGVLRAGGRIWPWALGSAYFFTALILVQTHWSVIPLSPRLDRIARETRGWQTLGQKALELQNTMPTPERTFIFGVRYQTASELAFYTPGKPRTVSINRWKRPNVYDYWWTDADLLGWDAVGVTWRPEVYTPLLKTVFEHVEEPLKLDIPPRPGPWNGERVSEPVQVFYLYRAYGFKGGLRWQPRRVSDIRAGGQP